MQKGQQKTFAISTRSPQAAKHSSMAGLLTHSWHRRLPSLLQKWHVADALAEFTAAGTVAGFHGIPF